MRLTTLARRYAGALFAAARGADIIDLVESDLGLITYSIESMPDLKVALEHPLIPRGRKKEIAREVFSGKVEAITLNFLDLLMDKRREAIIQDVELEYVQLANAFRGVTSATVTSAVPLAADELSALKAKLEEFTGKKVNLQLDEDSSLIGGVVIRIGDRIIDGSVRGYLASLKDKLLGRE